MLQTLARNPRTIAWILSTLFYLQLVLMPVVTRANERPLPFRYSKMPATIWKNPVSTKKTDIDKSAEKRLKHIPETGKKKFTTGPTQPEMQSFQSVNANNLVDPFSGDFSYNIPLLDVGGYPVNLHYQSGVTMDQEASWVGLGWNINPGVISRNMRGLPDDFQGGQDKVTKTVSIKPNRTIGGSIDRGIEIFGGPLNVGGGRSFSVFHNTYKGWGLERSMHASIGIGAGSHGSLTGGLSLTSNSQTGTDISPSMGFTLSSKEAQVQGSISIGTNYNSRTGIQNLQITGEIKRAADADRKRRFDPGVGRFSSSISFSKPSYTPTINIPYTSTGASFRMKTGLEGQGVFAYQSFKGYMSVQKVADEDKTLALPAYGYLNYEKANSNQNVLLDYNREKDVAWSESSPHIAVPIYTYDTWSISGEGTGGMFRPYRSDIGYVFDPKMSTKSKNNAIGVDLGVGSVLKVGADYNGVNAVTNNNAWTGDNRLVDVIPFRSADTTFENVYFKNPGEKTSVDKLYQQAIGGDYLMRVDLAGSQNNSVVTATRNLSLFKNGRATAKVNFDLNTLRKQRDKRNQVISYLTATEAAVVGLDTAIKVYPLNSFPSTSCKDGFTEIKRYTGLRQPHHLSEITVLNPDGRRYVYGIPVYNKKQVEITMSTPKGDNSTGLVSYDSTHKSTGNAEGKDGYFNREIMAPYSHSFLLSGILSNDYVDLTGDGITEDDNGDAVKFNYSQPYTLDHPYKWRAPYQANQAAYNEGLKTDGRDEKGSLTYGEREVWYLNSIISKTMIATFVLDTDSIRKDGYGVIDDNGGRGADDQKLYRLKKINLYTKADYIKNGPIKARPIKTVHFEYSYELCKKNPGSKSDSGKLTLKKVWFSYNNNEKGKRNPYLFTYNAVNPDFSQKSVDRWGNYKDAINNPGNTGQELTNADYPYTLQTGVKSWDATNADSNSAPWTLSEIKLPSGGKLKVTYESDDYAYVQNKRAMQFFSIAGFGSSPTSNPTALLYPNSTTNNDYHYVFINVSEAVSNQGEIARKYLDGVTQLFFKLAVNMPGDKWGSGHELVPCYAEIEQYGVASHIPNHNNKIIWIKVKSIKGKESPFATAAIQFLRLNLPSKAYPWSEPGDNIDIRTVVGLLSSVASSVVNLLKEAAFENKARNNNRCRIVVLDKTFARLDNPIYKKLGGGLRVKKTEIYDNWKKMTGQEEAKYGQTYTYTDTVMINGVRKGISSGVASYEPMIGGDENPFHVPAKVYSEKVGALAPTNYLYTEEPFAETFFPGPSIGYSKVTVQTMHKDKKSANGFDVTEFYTTKDFPTLVEYTPIDNDSKKSYKSPITNPFFFDSRNYVALSQGFKIELNDMNGKPKSNATYAQNDLNNPISYTYNYYRLVNDNAGQPKLSNTVPVADSMNGTIDMAGEIGKEVEIMIDVREQTSQTNSINIEANTDLIWLVPPISAPIFMIIPLFNGETNRYRAVSVLKIVNRYGILDSVIHIEKGSKVTTRNLVYDGETGDVVLSQTNNEFDDPVYNFNYPAHWAYTGMGPAYQNIGTVLQEVYFRKGIMEYANKQRVPVRRYFESGDELLVYGIDQRSSTTNDHCSDDYYQFTGDSVYKKIWAIDAFKGKQGQKGIYFIDRDGLPYSCNAGNIRIIRSGKRNMAGVSVGSITSLKSPVRTVDNVPRFVIDDSTGVIAAGAARFKDLWAVDSSTYAKDTQVISARKMTLQPYTAVAVDNYAIHNYKSGGGARALGALPNYKNFEASSYDAGEGNWDEQTMSWLKFNMSGIPQGALIKSATLHLYGRSNDPHKNYRNSNACYLERLKATWPRDAIPPIEFYKGPELIPYFSLENHTTIDPQNRVLLPATTHGADVARNEAVDITPMAQAMLDQYHSSNTEVSPGIRIRLENIYGATNAENKLTYNTQQSENECASTDADCKPFIEIFYYDPCADGSHPEYYASDPLGRISTAAAAPIGGYYCLDQLVDSIICKPNINDTAVNFYRFGVLGNWRMDRAYTYYGQRAQSDPAANTNIRTDGEIKDFEPFWAFTNTLLSASTDTSRWVWNSELTRFNNKGYEIENHDPLDRYNAGQYGYNQTLPVAIAQNAQNREIAFDGFEDYGYKTDTCKTCILNRHIDLGSGANLVDTVSHTGLHSLRLNGNYSFAKTFEIGSPGEVGVMPELSMKEDSIPLIDTTVHGNGEGLSNYYYTIEGGCHEWKEGKAGLYLGTSNVDYKNNGNRLPDEICQIQQIYYSFSGFIQPRYTGIYKFWVTANKIAAIWITGNGVTKKITAGSQVEVDGHTYSTAFETDTIALRAGELYSISILWDNYHDDNYQIKLEWESQGRNPQSREIVPKNQLYPDGSNPATVKSNTVFNDTTWCVKFNNPTAAHVLHKRLSPLQGQKVVVSAWVKQETPCISGNYENAQIILLFNNEVGNSYFQLKPTGKIIEGWQRVEDTLTIPATATSVTLSMHATSNAPVYFDDIRIHPFNGNMKSFVYNPVNLRLMAELDENNYATFYEYDDEGTLIRLKKETERGIKTIKETRSALLKE